MKNIIGQIVWLGTIRDIIRENPDSDTISLCEVCGDLKYKQRFETESRVTCKCGTKICSPD